MALVFVLCTKKPCTTSALVSRKRTGVEAGRTTHCGTNIYCSAIMRTVIEPSGSTAEPRLLSTNSPWRCKVAGLMVSTSLKGCSICETPVSTITASITPSMPAMPKSQRRSVLSMTRSETSPAAFSLLNWLANGPPAHEQHEIKKQPTCKEQPDRKCSNDQGSAGTIRQGCHGRFARDAGGYALWFAR